MNDWKCGQVVLREYVIEKELGRGGMGEVWLVKSNSTGRQFAVKKMLDEMGKYHRRFLESHRAFLAELQAWIDLPEHPNIVPCRFFRTVGDWMLIFSDFVDGGSLKEWIDSRRLYEGGPQKALERILDIAIQFAWGLHCVHETGMVHRDVKPSNVLIANGHGAMLQGIRVQVTDFGLARARVAAGETFDASSEHSVLVSRGGYTPAYCSPEQVKGQPVTRRTDVWSWGVSVLEMFVGEKTWKSGDTAPTVLKNLRERDSIDTRIPTMPPEVADVLAKCFMDTPDQRWKSLGQVVDRLKTIYHQTTGNEYTCTLTCIDSRVTSQKGIEERRTRDGVGWTDPRKWLERALQADGRDPAEAADIMARQGVSRRGKLVADIAVYNEARRIYERLIRAGQEELEIDLSILCMEAALVHETADDFQGALTFYDRALEIRDRLVSQEERRELTNSLATAYMNKANVILTLKDYRDAVTLYDSAIKIREQLVNQGGQRELVGDLATLYSNKAAAVLLLGDNNTALALYDRAIEIIEPLVNQEKRRELQNVLAKLYSNKALVISNLGDYEGAVTLYDCAIKIMERLMNQEGQKELENALAKLYSDKAVAVSHLGDNNGALALYDRAIKIRERLVNQEGRRELEDQLAILYSNKALVFSNLGDYKGAVVFYDHTIEINERLVNQEGRCNLADSLANVYMNKAIAVSKLGDNKGAVALYDQAIEIMERLVNQKGRHELANSLADVYVNKAIVVSESGDNNDAVTLYDRAIMIMEQLVNQEGRRNLADNLAKLYVNKATVIANLRDYNSAVALYDRAIKIVERLVSQEGRRELEDQLATFYMTKAVVVLALGDSKGAITLCDCAIEIRERLVNQEGRREFVGDLAKAKGFRAVFLILSGETKRGRHEAQIIMDTLRAEIKRTGRADLQEALQWVQVNLNGVA